MYRTVKQVSVRAGFDLDSEKVGTVAGGKVLEVLEVRENDQGKTRVRIHAGWTSVASKQGAALLLRTDDDADPTPDPVDVAAASPVVTPKLLPTANARKSCCTFMVSLQAPASVPTCTLNPCCHHCSAGAGKPNCNCEKGQYPRICRSGDKRAMSCWLRRRLCTKIKGTSSSRMPCCFK